MTPTDATGRPPRVVVTGIGAVSPFGAGTCALWSALREGKPGMTPLELFEASGHRTGLAAVVPDSALELPEELRAHDRHLGRTDRFALLSAWEAWQMAGLPTDDPAAACWGLFFGSSTGGMFEGENGYWRMQAAGPERTHASDFRAQPNGSPADAVARVFSLGGPVEVLATACAASTMALEAALDAIRGGEVELALAGGADGMCQTTFGGFNSLRAVDPEPARPFREDRVGLSLGEGGAMLVLETEDHAKARGATILAVLDGAASTCDAHHMTAPHPEGDGAARAIGAALRDADMDADGIGFVNAHGSGTPHNDEAEAKAFARVFGDGVGALPVTSTKGAVGHMLGSCGSLEAVVTILCLRAGLVHPTPGSGRIDPAAPVDLVLGDARAVEARSALSVNLAFGGANAALIVSRWDD